MDGKNSLLFNTHLYDVIYMKAQNQESFKRHFNDVI